MNRDVAIVSVAQSDHVAAEDRRNEVEMLMPVLAEVKANLDFTQADIDFTCSGSTDYLAGQSFSFVMTLDAVGALPPISESHVEMDGAWALYEAWVKIQTGEADTALVYGFGKSSPGDLPSRAVAPARPLLLYGRSGPTPVDRRPAGPGGARAGLTARDRARWPRSRPATQAGGDAIPTPQRVGRSIAALLAEDTCAEPLREPTAPDHRRRRRGDPGGGRPRVRELCERPAWITGIDHRIDAHALGARDLARSPSTALAAARRPASATGRSTSPSSTRRFTPPGADPAPEPRPGRRRRRQPVGRRAGGQPDDGRRPDPHRRGRPTGSRRRDADRAVAHATSGPCLQQNLVCVLEGDES